MNVNGDDETQLQIERNRLASDAESYVRLRAVVPPDVWARWLEIWDAPPEQTGVDT